MDMCLVFVMPLHFTLYVKWHAGNLVNLVSLETKSPIVFGVGVLLESTKTTFMEDVGTGVLEKNKRYLRSKDKAKNDMMYQDIYNCICQNTKKWRYTVLQKSNMGRAVMPCSIIVSLKIIFGLTF